MEAECIISILVSLMAVCAVFVTVTPLIHNAEIKRLSKQIQEIQKEIELLKKNLEEGVYDTVINNIREQIITGAPSILQQNINQ